MVLAGGAPAATIMDFAPMSSVSPFGMCRSPANPAVAAATAAAMGTLTPAACIPVTTPWQQGAPTVLVNGIPAASSNSRCMCAYGGQITVTMPGSAPLVELP